MEHPKFEILQSQKNKRLTFPEIPVGSWFIYSSNDNYDKIFDVVYFKVTSISAFILGKSGVYSHPEVFSADTHCYKIVTMEKNPTFLL